MKLFDDIMNLSEEEAKHVLFAATSYVEGANKHNIKIEADELLKFINENLRRFDK